jgi:hypothetical protein
MKMKKLNQIKPNKTTWIYDAGFAIYERMVRVMSRQTRMVSYGRWFCGRAAAVRADGV